ncbi:unnamed protein product [Coregonus sp. 'balchen']|nr:unnamed protein product [Coregonus sp. 'balchen']
MLLLHHPYPWITTDWNITLHVCSEKEQLYVRSLETTWDMAHTIEGATKGQSTSLDWHKLRRPRLTSSRFREVCHIRGQSLAENLANQIIKGSPQTAVTKRALAMEPAAVNEYCHIKNGNYTPCGFVIHPDALWLGSSPDGLIYDPIKSPQFGLLEIKCPNSKSYVDCPYLKFQRGKLELMPQHAYYCQEQGQMLITGLEWDDFVLFAEEDMLIQHIYKDSVVANTIKEKADH